MHSEESQVHIFDNGLKARQRDRAAWQSTGTDPLHDIVSERLIDRLDDCKDRTFRSVAILSGASAYLLPKLLKREGVERVVVMDSSNDQLERLKRHQPTGGRSLEFLKMNGEILPVEPESFDRE